MPKPRWRHATRPRRRTTAAARDYAETVARTRPHLEERPSPPCTHGHIVEDEDGRWCGLCGLKFPQEETP
jgi:hypothetical protein